MSRVLATASTLMIALSSHSAAHAVNLFQELDFPSLHAAQTAVQSALESRSKGEAEYWLVPGVAQGAVVPRRTWKSASGHWCREFEENIQLADGRKQTAVSVRCRTRDGRWRLIGK